jgi:hypothetical protein
MNTALKIVGIVLLALLGLIILGWVVRIVSFVFSLALGVLFIAGAIWLLTYLFKIGSNSGSPAKTFLVQDYTRNGVVLFSKEPAASDLLKAQMSSADSAEFGAELANSTEVIVLGEIRQGEAVRVRVKDGVY